MTKKNACYWIDLHLIESRKDIKLRNTGDNIERHCFISKL